LALDTRLVGGAATTSVALWSGVPVITLQGAHFASRMSASLLRAAGLEELITNDLEEYEALAVRLGSDLQELENLKQKTIRKRTAGRLFNTETTVKNLEHVFRRMWEDFAKGQKPKNIGI
jgi:protein O-GlcNAc transferase